MKERIGSISFEFDEKQIRKIFEAGQLEKFVEAATTLFKQDLIIELVKNGAAAGMTNLVAYDDGRRYGGPWPPIPLDDLEVNTPLVDMEVRVRAIEKANLEERLVDLERKFNK